MVVALNSLWYCGGRKHVVPRRGDLMRGVLSTVAEGGVAFVDDETDTMFPTVEHGALREQVAPQLVALHL